MASIEENFFDAIIVGTGLTESILAASRSLIIDPNPYYGGDEASLSQEELVKWGESVASGLQPTFESYSGSSETIPYSRQYSICLRPSVIPALGPLITGLIASGVAKYSGFKLLESVSIYSGDGTVKSVPGSKEAVFNNKDISLIEKRRLMRFLTFAGSEFEDKPEIQGKEQQPFNDFLKSTYQLSDDTITVIVYSLAHCVSARGTSSDVVIQFVLTTVDPTLPALLRLRGYVRGIGRYGPSPFLVGHYGGIGDISQGFCRAAAVSGGVYILGRPIVSAAFRSETTDSPNEGPYIEVCLEDLPEVLKSRVVISSRRCLPKDTPLPPFIIPSPPSVSQTPGIVKVARGAAILDKPIQFQRKLMAAVTEGEQGTGAALAPGGPLDTAVLIVPPNTVPSGSQDTAATVFINGENSLSAPKGRWIVYFILPLTSSEPAVTAESVLKPYLETVLKFTQSAEGEPAIPLSTSFYFEKQVPLDNARVQATQDTPRYIITPPLAHSTFPDLPDTAAYNAEAAFQQAVRSLRALKGDPVRDDEEIDFWPSIEDDGDSSDDDM
ncbi:hypothetical protein NMY22_g12058 [Coprinellus aureogranulatus]|nr:hypothetical protein NMY22_g12058 [Coprinellus aureogranulatus]